MANPFLTPPSNSLPTNPQYGGRFLVLNPNQFEIMEEYLIEEIGVYYWRSDLYGMIRIYVSAPPFTTRIGDEDVVFVMCAGIE